MAKMGFAKTLNRAVFAASPEEKPQKRSRRLPMDVIRGSASMDPIGESDPAKIGAKSSATSRAWQQQSWAYLDEIGEFGYSANFLGSCLSRCSLTIGARDKRGHMGAVFDEDGNPLEGFPDAEIALELLQKLKDAKGGQREMLRMFGINLTAVGECYLVGKPPVGQDASTTPVDQLTWEVLSTDELRVSPDGKTYQHYEVPGATPRKIEASDIHVIRIWRSHARFRALPDSSARRVLDILEELQLLTRQVRGETLSRLNSGKILLVPEEIEYANDVDDDGSGDAGDPFTRDLIATFAAAITDKGSAAQTVPFIVRAPSDHLHPDKFRVIDLSTNASTDGVAKREEAVQRFAQGIDLPVEVVKGHSGTTFANAVSIDDALYKAHVEPLLEIICEGLTTGYLTSALAALGKKDSPYEVFYDSTELVSRPNRAQDAKDVYDRFELSGSGLRSSTGFAESDAPDDKELEKRIFIKQATNSRVHTDEPGLEAIDVQAKEILERDNVTNESNVTTKGNETDKALTASIFGAVEVAIDQAVNRAGSRLRSMAFKDELLAKQISQVPNAEIPVTLGESLVEKLLEGSDPFHAQFDPLWSCVLRWTGDREYADQLRETCVAIASRRLYKPRQAFPIHELPSFSQKSTTTFTSDTQP